MSRTGTIRAVTASLAILVVVSGAAGKLDYGGICSLGFGQFLATCPLGFLERSLAAGELVPQWWLSVAMTVLSVVLLGRVFCAWICPSALLRRVFRRGPGLRSGPEGAPRAGTWASYSSYAVLAGVLVASFLFRFPVFCFVCPIGLFFGALYAGIKFFSLDSPGLELVLFPAMLVVELWVLRSWCRSICPLGALLSALGGVNRFLVPVVSKSSCLVSKGLNCRVCARSCSEGIDLAKTGSRFAPNSCTKCLECYEKCPAGAIEIAAVR
jgi:ferredoxin-type protein NapH